MELEVIVDDSGWRFVMPKIDGFIIEKFDLGTWDLADWTFGTPAAMFMLWGNPKTQFSNLTKLVWKLENKLRLKYWLNVFHQKRLRAAFYGCIRKFIFKIGWQLAIHDLEV